MRDHFQLCAPRGAALAALALAVALTAWAAPADARPRSRSATRIHEHSRARPARTMLHRFTSNVRSRLSRVRNGIRRWTPPRSDMRPSRDQAMAPLNRMLRSGRLSEGDVRQIQRLHPDFAPGHGINAPPEKRYPFVPRSAKQTRDVKRVFERMDSRGWID